MAIEAALAGASDPGLSSPTWSMMDLSSLEQTAPDLLKRAQALMASQEEHHGKKEREDRDKLLQDLQEHYKDMGISLSFCRPLDVSTASGKTHLSEMGRMRPDEQPFMDDFHLCEALPFVSC